MESQLKFTLIPLSARNISSLPLRQFSLPSCKLRHQKKIKINLKRLPNDFFQSPASMPDISPLTETMKKVRAGTQQTRRLNVGVETNNIMQMGRRNRMLSDGSLERIDAPKTEKIRMNQKSNLATEQSFQNTNIMNWTFSKQVFSQEKQKVAKSMPKPCIDQSSSNSGIFRPKIPYSVNPRLGISHKHQSNTARITNLLNEKLTQLNVNRLTKNIRKNNHPQSYLQYIKKNCS